MTIGVWSIRVNCRFARPVPDDPDAAAVAGMFGLAGATETLYDDFGFELSPGQIVAVVGPSGAGKTTLLRAAAECVPDAIQLAPATETDAPAIASLVAPGGPGGALADRLAVLSRCGLAEAAALVAPGRCLSGGQKYRLALASAVWRAVTAGEPRLLLIDEFAAALDATTAEVLACQMRRLVRQYPLGMLVSTPRTDLLAQLRPERVIVKPLGGPPRMCSLAECLPPTARGPAPPDGRHPARAWRIVPGTMADYHALGRFHYLAGPPSGIKRVWAIRPPRSRLRPGDPPVAGVLVVTPPVGSCRGRNLATGGRYSGPDRRAAIALLNEEVETIARVVVAPAYRGCGLGVRLVRRALRRAGTPLVEAIAAMGAVHPFFELAGMTAYRLPPDEAAERLLSAAEAVGLGRADVAAVAPVRRLLGGRRTRRGNFLKGELDRYIARTFDARRGGGINRIELACRRAARTTVYYLARAQPARRRTPGRARRDRKEAQP